MEMRYKTDLKYHSQLLFYHFSSILLIKAYMPILSLVTIMLDKKIKKENDIEMRMSYALLVLGYF